MLNLLAQVTALTVALAATATQAQPLQQEYLLKAYPSAAPACHALARDLGHRLASTYGVTLDAANCFANRDGVGVDLSILYSSESALPIVSTYDYDTFGDQGWYDSEATCRAALAGETEHFERATGLAAFHSVCQRDAGFFRRLWLARVDGFGSASKRPHFDDVPVFGSLIGMTPTQFATALKDRLADRGYDMRHAILTGSAGISHFRFSYYGAERSNFDVEGLATLANAADCQTELQRLDAAMAFDGSPLAASFCLGQITGGVELQGLFDGQSRYSFDYSVERYGSYQECVAARDELVDTYRTEYGRDVVGGICARLYVDLEPTNYWSVKMIEAIPAHDDMDQ